PGGWDRAGPVLAGAGGVVASVVPVPTPLPDVAVPVVQPEGIGVDRADRRGLIAGFALGCATVGGAAVEVSLGRGEGGTDVEGGGGASAAGVLPLRLRGQAILAACFHFCGQLRELLQESLGLLPADPLHREPAGVQTLYLGL